MAFIGSPLTYTAFFESEPPESIYTPIPFSPPELIFGKPLDKKIDIWNLGCTVSIQKYSEAIS